MMKESKVLQVVGYYLINTTLSPPQKKKFERKGSIKDSERVGNESNSHPKQGEGVEKTRIN